MTDRETYVVAPPKDGPQAAVTVAVQEEVIGIAVGQLLVAWPDWVERRVESIKFADEGTVSRQMSVDFQLPSRLGSISDMVEFTLAPPVPLATLRKEKLTHFNLWNERGSRLSMLNKKANARVAGASLVALASSAASEMDTGTIPTPVRQFFYAVAGGSEQAAFFLMDGVEEGLKKRVNRWGLKSPDRDFNHLVPTLYAHEPLIRELLDWDGGYLRAISRKLAAEFIVLVPLEGEIFARRLIKLSYEEPATRLDTGATAWRVLKGIGQRCSWVPKEYSFQRINVGTSESHHFEIEVPEYTEIIRADLVARERGKPSVSDTDSGHKRRAHLRLDVGAAGATASATAAVRLRASRGGVVTAGAVGGIFVAGVFWAGATRLSHIDTAAAAAILLSVPALLVVYLARPGEHALASVMLSGVRAMLAISGLCLFVAAGAVAGGLHVRPTSSRPNATAGSAAAIKGSTSPAEPKRITKTPAAGPRAATEALRGPYLDCVWAVLKWVTSVLAFLLLLSYSLPRRARLTE